MKGRRMWALELLAAMAPGDTIPAGIPARQQAQPRQGRSPGDKENGTEKRKSLLGEAGWLVRSCSRNRPEEPVTVTVPSPTLGRSHCSNTPHSPALQLTALPRTPLRQKQQVSHREIFFFYLFSVHLLLRKLRHIPGLFYCSCNDKLHVNVWKATFCTVLFRTDNLFEKLSKCINNSPAGSIKVLGEVSILIYNNFQLS